MPPNEQFTLLLLKHSTHPIFRVGQPRSADGRDKMLASNSFDIAGSWLVRFSDRTTRDRTTATLQKLISSAKTDTPPESGAWYQADVFDSLVGMCRDTDLVPGVLAPLGDVVSTHPLAGVTLAPEAWLEREEERKATLAQNLAAREQRVLEHLQWEAENAARAAVRKQQEAVELQALVNERRESGRFISIDHIPESELQAISDLLARINVASNGHCKLLPRVGDCLDLDVYLRKTSLSEAEDAAAHLRDIVTFEYKTNADGILTNYVRRPFGYLSDTIPRSRVPGISHRNLKVSVREPYLMDALLALKPGIRGWDLPIHAPVLGFNPSLAQKTGRSTPPKACAVRKAWESGRPCNHAQIHQYLKRFEVKLGWEPPALRYLASSPFAGDLGAPIAMLRLLEGSMQVGFQKIMLNSGARESLSFDGFSTDNACSLIWAIKESIGIATCLEDALALQSKRMIRCIVTPTPRGLEELTLPPEVQTVTLYAPGLDPETWAAAADNLSMRMKDRGLVIAVEYPLEYTTCDDIPYPAEWARQLTR